ncbi:PcfJ domain-containing protein [Aeromonas hydrophila]
MKTLLLKNRVIISFYPLLKIIIDVRFFDIYHRVTVYDEHMQSETSYNVGLPILSMFPDLINKNDFIADIMSSQFVKSLTHKQSFFSNALAIYPELLDVFRTSPTLAWLICVKLYDDSSAHVMHHYARLKRKDILTKIVGLDMAERHVKFVGKIKILNGSDHEADEIIKAISKDDLVDSFKHEEKVFVSDIYVLNSYPSLIGSKIISGFNKGIDNRLGTYKIGVQRVNDLYMDTINIGAHIGIKNSSHIVRSCKSKQELFKVHDGWIEILNKNKKFLEHDEALPALDIDHPDFMSQIRSINQLIQEGIEMEHCVVTYLDKLRDRTSFIYKVIAGERVTMEVGLRGKEIYIKQIKLRKNKEPSLKTTNMLFSVVQKINNDMKL